MPNSNGPSAEARQTSLLKRQRKAGTVLDGAAAKAASAKKAKIRGSTPPAAAPLTSEEARQQAEAEGLTLRVADNKTGYFSVHLTYPGQPKPYQARVSRDGKVVHLGTFATAKEAAAAKRAASVPQPRRSEEEGQGNAPARRSRAVLKQEGTVPPMPPGAFVKEEEFPPMPPGAFVKEEVIVKRELEVVVDEGGPSEGSRSEGRPKRRRNA